MRFAWFRRDSTAERNYRLGLLNGWVVSIGDGFMHPSVVLAAFAAKLGASNAVIGLFPAIIWGGWMLPQILIAARLRAQPYKLPLYRRAAIVRTVTYLWMIAVSALLADQPAWLLTAFIAGLAVNALASGVSGLPFLEVVSKTVPRERRAAYFGLRNLIGGVLAFLSGFAVREILASPLPFPLNYTLIFTLATLAFTLGYALFGRIEEPPDPPQEPSALRAELRAIPETLRGDAHFRAFLSVRLLLAAASLSDPFYAVYALRELHLPTAMLGVFLMALAGAAPLSNLVWTRLAQRRGSRRLIRWAAGCAALAPLLALTLPAGMPFLPYAYMAVFIATSVAAQGFNLGHTNHLLNIAPPHARSRYIGTLNTLVGVALFAPVLGGVLADTLGYRAVFSISVILYAAAWWRAGRLRRDA